MALHLEIMQRNPELLLEPCPTFYRNIIRSSTEGLTGGDRNMHRLHPSS
jgi:hypothetical protein